MIFVIVPAYNEEQTIGRVVRGLFEQNSDWKIIVVDDGSKDRTAEIAKSEGAVVLRHAVNRGQGAALETGDEFALSQNAEAVVHFDADGQLNPADIPGTLKIMKDNNLDAVLGSRFLDNRSKLPWSKRYLILPVSRWINYLFTGVKLTDAHNGFRILSRAALGKIKITHDGMSHNSEIVAQIKKYNLKFAEYPVEVTYHEFGQGLRGGIKIIGDLLVNPLLK